ncbi:MAG: succinylglutamate desuccinylase/aspartoacylase family protein [Thalassobaculales bacterium]
MASPTRIVAEIDLDAPGRTLGWLSLPHSVTRSAYGEIRIPIACLAGGRGPTLLLMAGNHGDEYEGQIALLKLIRELDPATLAGRVIVLPAANLPAALAGTRVSPIDGGNMNRCFGGDPERGPTWAIAHYIETRLFPLADQFCDLHSGGSSLDYLPFASVHQGSDPALDARCLAALKAFAAPLSIIWKLAEDARYSPAAAMRQGVPALGGEFGGCGRVSRPALAMLEAGLGRLLAHLGIAAGAGVAAAGPVRLMAVPGNDWMVYAPAPGLFEPAVALGDTVAAGELAGQVHFVDDPGRPPVPVRFREGGLVVCQRHFGRVERGDCVAHLAVDDDG